MLSFKNYFPTLTNTTTTSDITRRDTSQEISTKFCKPVKVGAWWDQDGREYQMCILGLLTLAKSSCCPFCSGELFNFNNLGNYFTQTLFQDRVMTLTTLSFLVKIMFYFQINTFIIPTTTRRLQGFMETLLNRFRVEMHYYTSTQRVLFQFLYFCRPGQSRSLTLYI